MDGNTLVDTAPGNDVVFNSLLDTAPAADGVLVDGVNTEVCFADEVTVGDIVDSASGDVAPLAPVYAGDVLTTDDAWVVDGHTGELAPTVVPNTDVVLPATDKRDEGVVNGVLVTWRVVSGVV